MTDFQVGDWVVRHRSRGSSWTGSFGAERVTAVGSGIDILGVFYSPRIIAGHNWGKVYFRFATLTEIAARKIQEGDWVCAREDWDQHELKGRGAFRVLTVDTHSGKCWAEEGLRHATAVEYRQAMRDRGVTNKSPAGMAKTSFGGLIVYDLTRPTKKNTVRPVETLAILDKKKTDTFDYPREEGILSMKPDATEDAPLEQSHDDREIDVDKLQQTLGNVETRLALLESQPEAPAVPSLPPLLRDRVTKDGPYIDTGQDTEGRGQRRYYRGNPNNRGNGDVGQGSYRAWPSAMEPIPEDEIYTAYDLSVADRSGFNNGYREARARALKIAGVILSLALGAGAWFWQNPHECIEPSYMVYHQTHRGWDLISVTRDLEIPCEGESK